MKIQIFALLEQYIQQCSPDIKNSKSIQSFIEKFKLGLISKLDQNKSFSQDVIADTIEEIIISNKGDKKGLVELNQGKA